MSVNLFSIRFSSSVVLDPDHKDFSGDTDGLIITTSCRFNSDKTIDRLDEARDEIPVELGDLSVSKKNFTGKHTLIKAMLMLTVSDRYSYKLLQHTWNYCVGKTTMLKFEIEVTSLVDEPMTKNKHFLELRTFDNSNSKFF